MYCLGRTGALKVKQVFLSFSPRQLYGTHSGGSAPTPTFKGFVFYSVKWQGMKGDLHTLLILYVIDSMEPVNCIRDINVMPNYFTDSSYIFVSQVEKNRIVC